MCVKAFHGVEGEESGGKSILMAVGFEFDRHGFEGYLGNVGLSLELKTKTGDCKQKIYDHP